MLSDEERQKLEQEFQYALDNIVGKIKGETATAIVCSEQSMILLFRKLMLKIEKQSKEIEELKQELEKEKEKNKELNKYIEDRAKIGKNIQTFINKDYVEQEYISKDKIKEIIEKLEKKQEDNRKDLYNAVNNLY